LAEKRRAFYEKLSGGQKQRLAMALAMVNNPELVLLDEPTVGLDAQLRRDIYALIERFREERRTTLLTTHYIEEAERLCDRVAIIDHGQVIALGHHASWCSDPARARASRRHLPSPFLLTA
jgi:ABC-2 type transport system ATP-binding protein